MTWEKRFDKYFNQPGMNLPVDALKDFIRQEIEKVEAECPEALAEMNDHWNEVLKANLSNQLDELKAEVEGMVFKDRNEAGQFALHIDGYNEAIEEVLDLIESKK